MSNPKGKKRQLSQYQGTNNTNNTNSSRSNNPLSNARGKDNADAIWFRKVGGGYNCFIEYYTQQPIGTVSNSIVATASTIVTSDHPHHDNNRDTIIFSSKRDVIQTQTQTQGAGCSRASKRRQKKRKQQFDIDDCSNNNTVTKLNKPLVNAVVKPTTIVSNNNNATSTNNSLSNRIHSKEEDKISASNNFHNVRLLQAIAGNNIMYKNFFLSMCQPLPLTFRIRETADTIHTKTFVDTINNEKMKIKPSTISLYSKSTNFIYQSDGYSKSDINSTMKDLLLVYSQNGTIARQELGSMLPIALLQRLGCFSATSITTIANEKQKIIKFLDLCASPGSKTLQALELLVLELSNINSNDRNDNNQQNIKSPRPRVVVVANDILQKRLDSLQDAVQRSGMQHNIVESIINYTCQDATKFNLQTAVRNSNNNNNSTSKTSTKTTLFDIILCDVPCSGDGTCRKDKHILPSWTPDIGNQLHVTQLAIVSRAVELVQVGGYICYSTCSLNPIENEAIICSVLQKYNKTQKTIDIVPCENNIIPNLILRDGITSWKVATYDWNSTTDNDTVSHSKLDNDDDDDNDNDNDDLKRDTTCTNEGNSQQQLQWFDTYHDATMASNKKNNNNNNNNTTMNFHQWQESMWPPNNVKELNLHYCKRLWPQDQNSGGFFLCVLKKIS